MFNGSYVHEIHSDHIVEPLHVIQIVIQLKNVFFFFLLWPRTVRDTHLSQIVPDRLSTRMFRLTSDWSDHPRTQE